MGTKKGQMRKTARRAYTKKRQKKVRAAQDFGLYLPRYRRTNTPKYEQLDLWKMLMGRNGK